MSLLQVDEFPNCCGAKIVSKFPYAPCATVIKGYVKELKEILEKECSNSCYFFATLNKDQVLGGSEKILLECGFEIIGTALNKNSYNDVRAYVYVRANEEAKRDPKYNRPW